ncbi:MAG: serine/threonine protein kinase [Gemmataceae bacterium]
MASVTIGKFQILGTLGQGAHSTILHVRRSADSKQYALKVVPINSKDDHKFLDQARHEFEVAQRLDHPHLIKIHALEEQRDWLFRVKKVHLLVDYVNGKTMDQFQRVKLPHLVQIFARVASGLAHMHRRRVLHADLKPNNILLSHTGDVKVIDYGLAWIKGENKDRVQGTPEYMAPEQARKKMVNEQTDIYNFGATMYRLVTLRLPPSPLPGKGGLMLDGKTWDAAIKPVTECCTGVPPALGMLIERCLSYTPSKRPERVSELLTALESLAQDLVREPEDELSALDWTGNE